MAFAQMTFRESLRDGVCATPSIVWKLAPMFSIIWDCVAQ